MLAYIYLLWVLYFVLRRSVGVDGGGYRFVATWWTSGALPQQSWRRLEGKKKRRRKKRWSWQGSYSTDEKKANIFVFTSLNKPFKSPIPIQLRVRPDFKNVKYASIPPSNNFSSLQTQEKKEGKENTETQAIDAKVTETDDGGGDSAVEAPGEEGKTSPDGEDEEVLADAKIPFGPLGSILPEDYSDLERQVCRYTPF